MRFVIQRVKRASVTVEGELIGKINAGLMILVGISPQDTDEYIAHVCDKFLNMRLFKDAKGTAWKESVISLGLEILLVSQFTLYGYFKGNKPDFHGAMEGEQAKVLFDKIVECCRNKYKRDKIQTGKFGHYMQVELLNDGPVTLEWDYPTEAVLETTKVRGKIPKGLADADNKGKKNAKKDVCNDVVFV